MKKSAIKGICISLVMLLMLSGVSSAKYGAGSDDAGKDFNITANDSLKQVRGPPPLPGPNSPKQLMLRLHKGWNLMTLPGEGNLSAGDCNKSKQHAFMYDENKSKYESLGNATRRMGEKKVKEHMQKAPFWVYSYDDCAMKFAAKNRGQMNAVKMRKGTNFAPITDDMIGNRMREIKGDCEIMKANYWNASKQAWQEMGENDTISEEMTYGGFVAQIRNACGFAHRTAAQAGNGDNNDLDDDLDDDEDEDDEDEDDDEDEAEDDDEGDEDEE